jgi:hypothetical protein
MTSLQDSPSALDRLPADQRAVLQLVLARGKSYDDIAQRLSIDRAAVRQRALAAFDALGPASRVPAPQRGLITDYLLGQLPPRVGTEVRKNLAQSASERAWARVVASELTPVSTKPLPEIPVAMPEREPEPTRRRVRRRDEDALGDSVEAATVVDGAAAEDSKVAEPRHARREPPSLRSSRLGGAILLGAVAAAAIAAILVFAVFGVGGGASHKPKPATGARVGSTTSTTSRPLAQINLTSPTGGKAVGIAEVIKAGGATGIVIVAQGLAANSKHDAYAVWLANGSDYYRLGYVQQAVTSTGRLQTAGRLPSNASHFKQILVALQTGPATKPGKIVLEGTLSGV